VDRQGSLLESGTPPEGTSRNLPGRPGTIG
jgi:hypothetical protein